MIGNRIEFKLHTVRAQCTAVLTIVQYMRLLWVHCLNGFNPVGTVNLLFE